MTQFDWYIPEKYSNFSMNDLAIEVLVRLDISSYNELVRISGLANTLAAIRPNYKNIANNVAIEARKKLGLKGNGIDAVVAPFMYGQATCVPSGKLKVEIKESFLSKEEALKQFSLMNLPEESGNLIRIIQVGDYDSCPCSGLHVSNTSEIGTFDISTVSYDSGVLRIRYKLL